MTLQARWERRVFQIMAILKAMEVNVLRERTVKGLEAARLEGRIGGRPAGSYNKKKASAVVALYNQKNTINFIEDNLNISRSTIYQYLRKEGVKVNGFKKSKYILIQWKLWIINYYEKG